MGDKNLQLSHFHFLNMFFLHSECLLQARLGHSGRSSHHRTWFKSKATLYPMSNSMGGAENANDLLSSNSCLREVVVGVSSSENVLKKQYPKANWRVGRVIIRSFCE